MPFVATNLATAFLALVVERKLGYPAWMSHRVGHPVMWIGALISWSERSFNNPERPASHRRLFGIVMLCALIAIWGGIATLVMLAAREVPYGWVAEALFATSLFCQNELRTRVGQVADALDRNLEHGREAVSHLVGRDHQELDASAVAKSAIESLAENSSDGIVAPVFWMIIGGLPGLVIYKAVNTADSMVGYTSPRYLAFGWASARLDDLANYIPARITALLYCFAAFTVRGSKPSTVWSSTMRDASKHVSPNAGWPEAAMAGALGIALGGPRSYGGRSNPLPYLGDGRKHVRSEDIRAALKLYQAMLNAVLLLIALAFCVWALS